MKKIEYLVEKFDWLSNKIGKHNVMLIMFITVVLLITGLYSTFSLFTTSEGIEIVDGVRTYKFILDPTMSETSVIVPANTEKNIDIVVTNNEDSNLNYGIYYETISDIVLGTVGNSLAPGSGVISKNTANTVSIKLTNNSSYNATIEFGIKYGLENGGELTLEEDANWVGVYPEKLSLYVTNLFNDESLKKTVNIGGNIVNPVVRLNEDKGIMLDNNGEYRYYGASPNNYVSYNDELWRIIGVSNVKSSSDDEVGETRVKIVKATPMVDDNGLATYSWDSSDSSINDGNGVNDWSQADLMTELNDLYFYSGSGNCYVGENNSLTACNFSNTGLSEDAQTLSSDALYYLGGYSTNENLFAHDIYKFEKGNEIYNCGNDDGACPRTTVWDGQVGLMYPSDYAYATDLSICLNDVKNYEIDDNCKKNNWLLYSENDMWLISPTAHYSYGAFRVNYVGGIYGGYTSGTKAIFPVLYLDANVIVTGGEGTSDNPYKLALGQKEETLVYVTFDTGGADIEISGKFVAVDSSYGELPTVERVGYTFNGWYTEATGGDVVTSDMIVNTNEDFSIYANWTANTYNITFDANGGSVDTASMEVTYDNIYGTLPTPTTSQVGYSFGGWYTEATGGELISSSSIVKITSDTTLYARWTANTYTVNLDANEGSVNPTSITVTYDSTYSNLPTPTRTGYTFDGWYTALEGGSQVTSTTSVTITETQTLYARWTANQYTVTLNANGGSTSTSSKTVTYGSAYGDLPTPTMAGYTFDGWYTALTDGTQVTSSTIVSITGAQTLYAQWTQWFFSPTLLSTAVSDASLDYSVTSDSSGTNGLYVIDDTTDDTYPIYFYRGAVDNNLIFAGFCWKMVRTTETGGLKLLYNGVPSSGTCDNTGTATHIGTIEFNSSSNSPAYVGYMYGTPYTYTRKSLSSDTTSYIYGNSVSYSNGTYTLTDTTSGAWSNVYSSGLNNYHYTCFTTGTTCTKVYYIYYTTSSYAYYITLNGVESVDVALSQMLDYNTNSSTVKGNNTTSGTLDYWYYTNISGTTYENYIEDTVWCNDRSIVTKNGWNPNGGKTRDMMFFGTWKKITGTFTSDLSCPREIDRFTVSDANGNGDLDYPVGLLTGVEHMMAGAKYATSNKSFYLYASSNYGYWGMSPYYFYYNSANGASLRYEGGIIDGALSNDTGVRPAISLKKGFLVSDGSGTTTSPYVVITE